MEKLLPCFLIFISLFNHAYCIKCLPYNAIFSFGNSFADTGNFVILTKGVLPYNSFEHSPYGMTYFRQPTGRGSDGRLVVDFIAQDLGFPLIPPYFSKGQDFKHGANFAAIGSTALPLDYFRQHNMTNVPPVDTSASVQLGWFNQLKSSICNTTKACKAYFKKSLFIVGEFGGNDYTFVLSAGKSVNEVMSYVPPVIDSIKETAEVEMNSCNKFCNFHHYGIMYCLKSLLKQGAVNIVVAGNIPTGCIPIFLTLYASSHKSDYDCFGCLKSFNTIGLYHNIKLKEAVVQLKLKYPKAKISYADYYKPMIRFLKNPKHFGFTNGAPLKICCGRGGPYNYNLTASCGYPGVSACSNPSTYINWDGIHLTEAAYRIIATGWSPLRDIADGNNDNCH